MTGSWADPVCGRPGWEPDEHLVHTALAGRVDARALPGPDRAHVVTELTRRGLTANEVADRLSCSLRFVRNVQADPVTAVYVYAAAQRDAAAALDADHRRTVARLTRERDEQRAAAERYRAQRDDLIDRRARARHRV